MGEMLDWWLSGGDWADLKQNRRIEEIEASHAAQVASVRSTLSRQTSAIDARVDRLERALLAFVELEDTRAVLQEFADAAAARRYARDIAQRLLGGDAPARPPAPPADLPGYWLTPAIKAVVADLYPGTDDAAALRTEARARDDVQAELFDVLAAALGAPDGGQGADVERWLPRAAELTRAQLIIGTEVARGRFGATARVALVERLCTLRDDPSVRAALATALPELAEWSNADPAPRSGSGRAGDGPAVRAAERAAADLARLAAMVAAPTAAAPTPAGVRDDPLAELLAVLINEGAPGEAPVIQRMAAIRASLAGVGVPGPPAVQSTSDGAGNVGAVLAGWLAARADPALHAVALEVLAPLIADAATLRERAAGADVPETSEVSVAGRLVAVGPDGSAETAWQGAAAGTVAAPPPWAAPAAAALGAVTVVAGVLAVAFAPAWWVLAVVAGAAAAGTWWWLRRARLDVRSRRGLAVADGQRRIDEEANALRRARARAATRTAEVREARAAIDAAAATAGSLRP